MRNTLQPLIAVSALLLAALLGTALPASGNASAASPDPVQARLPFERPVAEAVRAAFDAERVEVEFSRIDVVASNPAQRELAATGRVAVDGSGWIPLQVSALYDVSTAAATTQRLSLGAAEAGRSVAADALAARLSTEASRRLQAEFDGQQARMELAGVEARRVGDGLVALEAVGRADFAGEGVAATSVQALYDPRSERWLRLDYRLGSAGMGEPVAGL